MTLIWIFISLIFKLDKNYSMLLVNNSVLPVNIIDNGVQNSSLKIIGVLGPLIAYLRTSLKL